MRKNCWIITTVKQKRFILCYDFLGLRWLEIILNLGNLLSVLLGVVGSWSSPSHFKFCRVLALLKENLKKVYFGEAKTVNWQITQIRMEPGRHENSSNKTLNFNKQLRTISELKVFKYLPPKLPWKVSENFLNLVVTKKWWRNIYRCCYGPSP